MTIKKEYLLNIRDVVGLIFFSYYIAIRPIEGDTFNYFQFFNNLNTFTEIPKVLIFYLSSIDYIFGFFSFVVKQVTDDFYNYLFILNFFVFGMIYYFSKEFFNKKRILMILLFIASPVYFFILGNAIRQGLGLGFFIIFIYFFWKQNFLFSYIFLLFAVFSHPVYIVVFPFLIFYKFFYKYDFVLKLLLFLSFSFIIFQIEIITSIIGLFDNFYVQKYIGYAAHHKTDFTKLLTFDFIKSVILYVFVIQYYSKLKEFKKIILLFLYLFSVQLMVFFNQLVFVRISSLKEMVEIILIIVFINNLKYNQKKFAYFLLVIFIIFNFLRFVR